MSEQPRDWDREMADIDRAIAKQGSVPPSAPSRSSMLVKPAPAPRSATSKPTPSSLTMKARLAASSCTSTVTEAPSPEYFPALPE